MIGTILTKIFKSANERALRKLQPVVAEISALEPQMQALSDDALRAKTDEFKKRLAEGETLDDLLVETFAVVREAGRRTIKMRHFDVQLIGGMVLHQGKIAEMATGEGKTLVATLAVYLNTLEGKGVHVVTVNDYLARRDRNWMGPIYEFLGLTVGVIQHDMDPVERQKAYGSDVTYGTNNEFGFDYLRDNMVADLTQRVQRGLHYAIVDEVDSILVDEARTPLIISGPAEESTDKYYTAKKIADQLKGRDVTEKEQIEAKYSGENLGKGFDYLADEKAQTISLTEEGEVKASRLWGIESMHTIETMDFRHHTIQALRAKRFYKHDVDYVVKDGQVIIVDEFTGRLMPGRRWSDGLHQAVEAKEGMKIERENQTLATVTFQNYFRMYKKLAGMTGTAATEAEEFSKIYKLDVVVIPTNRPLIRTNHPDVIYRTEREKFSAVVDEIAKLYTLGRPVLVGTVSIEKSERLSDLLQRRNLPHTVLNAKYHEKEAEIVAQAGQDGAITIATNMAGRGTDIVLGPGVAEKRGLHVIGTERHEARRIDNQLRGRSGRQGDPGSSRFYLALEDDLMRLFGSDRIKGIMEKLGMEEGQDIQHPLITKSIETAQKRVETRNFEIRKDLLKYDDVMNRQREIVYAERDRILKSEDMKDHIVEMLGDVVHILVQTYIGEDLKEEDQNEEALWSELHLKFGLSFVGLRDKGLKPAELEDEIMERLVAHLEEREKTLGKPLMLYLEKSVLLQVIDAKWKDHLYAMDNLRDSIGFRAYGQRDPLVEYQHEAFHMFDEMIDSIKHEIAEFIFKVQIRPEAEQRLRSVLSSTAQELIHKEFQPGAVAAELARGIPEEEAGPRHAVPAQGPESAPPSGPSTYRRETPKVGRNDPCPCGSGKKYKKCHGAG